MDITEFLFYYSAFIYYQKHKGSKYVESDGRLCAYPEIVDDFIEYLDIIKDRLDLDDILSKLNDRIVSVKSSEIDIKFDVVDGEIIQLGE